MLTSKLKAASKKRVNTAGVLAQGSAQATRPCMWLHVYRFIIKSTEWQCGVLIGQHALVAMQHAETAACPRHEGHSVLHELDSIYCTVSASAITLKQTSPFVPVALRDGVLPPGSNEHGHDAV